MKFEDRSTPSRRKVLSLMAVTGAAMMTPGAIFADDIDPRVDEILKKYAGVDQHNHCPVNLLEQGKADPAKDPIVDLASEEKRSGFAALCYTYALDSLKDPKPEGYYNAHIQALDQIDRLLAQQKMRRVLNLKQLEAAHKKEEPVIIQAAEGAQFIQGRLDRIEEAYNRGMRHLQLVHHADNPGNPIGDVQNAPSIGGLTPFGTRVIKECNRLHMVVDLAHGGFLMVKAAAGVATQPFVISHCALDTPLGRHGREMSSTSASIKDTYKGADEGIFRRLVKPEHAKIVADAGGVVGIWHLFPTLKDFVTGIKQMVDVIGADHVGIGTDTSMGSKRSGTNAFFPDQHGGFMVATANEMLKQGFKPDEVGKIAGGNYCRVFGKVTEGRA